MRRNLTGKYSKVVSLVKVSILIEHLLQKNSDQALSVWIKVINVERAPTQSPTWNIQLYLPPTHPLGISFTNVPQASSSLNHSMIVQKAEVV